MVDFDAPDRDLGFGCPRPQALAIRDDGSAVSVAFVSLGPQGFRIAITTADAGATPPHLVTVAAPPPPAI